MKHVQFHTLFLFILALTFLASAGDKRPDNITEKKKSFRTITKVKGSGNYVVQTVDQRIENNNKTSSDQQQWNDQIIMIKKRFDQRAFMKQKHTLDQKAEELRTMRNSLNAPQLERTTLLGKPTLFYKGPSIEKPAQLPKISRPMVSNVLINGKAHDTVFVGEPFTMTFSFSPNFATAAVNVYLDRDNNGIISAGDILLVRNGLVFDNSDSDGDPAVGAFKLEFPAGNGYSNFLSTLIFEVNDFQSISTVMLTVKQKPSIAVLKGTISPAKPNIMLVVNRNPDDYVYVFTDSVGNFSTPIDRQLTDMVNVSYGFEFGMISGYLPPSNNSIAITSDTTLVTISYKPATAFIDGYVKDQYGNGIGNVMIETYGPSADLFAFTDSTGFYTIGVSSGNWYLYGTIDWTNTYLRYSSSISVTVPSNSTIHKNIPFIKSNATISGKTFFNAAGIGGIPIYVSTDSVSNHILTSADGTYSVPVYKPAVGTKVYTVQASVPSGYYVLIPTQSGIAPDATNINFSIVKVTGGAQGKILDEHTGNPIPHASLYFSGVYSRFTSSNDSGYYHVSLRDGQYTLQVEASAYYQYSESYIMISGGFITKNISLSRSGSYSGTVKDEKGKPIINANISTIDSTGYSVSSTVYSDNSGKYIFGNLKTGKYRSFVSANGYITQWYNKVYQKESATAFQVIEKYDTPDINFVLTHGGSISGTVVDISGKPLPNIYIEVYDSLNMWLSYATTNDSGQYTATGLSTGKYYVKSYDGEGMYYDQWYNGVTTFEKATKVNVVMNQTTNNINFTLKKGCSITGIVHDKKNTGIEYAQISVHDSTFSTIVAYGTSNSFGEYNIDPLEPNKTYYVHAQKWNSGNISEQWYNNVSTQDSATPIILQPEEIRSNIDFTLNQGGGISGTVYDRSGLPLPYASVSVEDSSGMKYFYGYCNAQGQYAINYISDGKYYVHATHTIEYKDQWYNHKTSRATADPVSVVDESVTPNINFNLETYGNSGDSILVKIKLDKIADTLTFSQSYVGDNYVDYWWGVLFDVDSNVSTGFNGCEIELALIHSKNPGEPPFKSTIINGTSHVLMEWIGNSGYHRHSNVSVWIDPADNNTLVLAVPKSWAETKNITARTKYYLHAMYVAQQMTSEDVTSVAYGWETITDPVGDVPYNFIDIVSANIKDKTVNIVRTDNVAVEYRLDQNYPNPFNPSTLISYQLPVNGKVHLIIYDLLGREIAALVNEEQSAGLKEVRWNAAGFSSGIYFYKLTARNFVEMKKMILVK